MGAAWIGRMTAALILLTSAGPIRADELQPPPAPPDAAKSIPQEKPAAIPASDSTPLESKPAAFNSAALRLETLRRLETLAKLDEKSDPSAAKALGKLFTERLARLDQLDKAVKQRQTLENPSPTPEKEAAEWKADLERVLGLLDQGAKSPDRLLSTTLRKEAEASAKTPEAIQTGLKEAIEAAQAELKDWTAKLEQLTADPLLKEGAVLGPIRADREKLYKRVTLLRSRNPEREAGLADAKTPEAREAAREAIVNLDCKTKLAAEELRVEEARLALETKHVENAPFYKKLLEAHVRLAKASLDQLKTRYQSLTAIREKDLREKAKREETLAKLSEDPIERYRAKRSAEILDERALVLKSDNMLATDPSPSLSEQTELAEKAFKDLDEVKHLLADGEVSHLDALRLTNDFRRIGPERGRIASNEMTESAASLTRAENALSNAELELIYDSRDDGYELDGLLERLPKSRHAEAKALFEGFEKQHFELLNKRRDNLEKLATRAQQTYDQVVRHLRILDEHFGFIRTHIFWVRDEEAITTTTIFQAERDLAQLGRAAVRMASELSDRPSWGRVSAEFIGGCCGLVILPWPLYRIRRSVRRHGRMNNA